MTTFEKYNPWIHPINCTDPPVAAPPHRIVGEKTDSDLGTLDSRESPYIIRIDFHIGHCMIVLPFQSFPLNKGFYCVKKRIAHHDDNFLANLDDSYGDHTIKYGFVSQRG